MEKIHFFALPVCLVTAMIACCPFNGYAYSIQQSSEIRRVTLQAINPQNSIPVGTVIPWPSDKEIPSPMWLPCNGQAVPTGDKYDLIKSLVGPSLPDYNNAVRDDIEGGGVQNGGYFLRASMGDAASGGLMAANADMTRFHKHKQDPHRHKVEMMLSSPVVSGDAYGQKYYEYITGQEDVMNGVLVTGKGKEFYAQMDAEERKRDETGEYFFSLKNEYNLKKEYLGGGEDITPKNIGDYAFPNANVFLGGAAFVYPEDTTEVDLYGAVGCKDSGAVSVSMKVKATIPAGVTYTQASEAIWGIGRGIMAGTDMAEDTKLVPEETQLVDDTVTAEILYAGNEDSGETGGAETTPVYRNVLFIIKVIQ